MADDKIQTFDPDALKERIAESVQSTFGMLIPADQWKEMIERDVKAFFEEPSSPFSITDERVRDGWGSEKVVSHHLTTKLTPFRALVWKKCADLCMIEIDKALGGGGLRSIIETEWKYPSDGGAGQLVTKAVTLGELLEKKLEELAPKMAATLFRDMFGAAVEKAKGDLRRELIQGQHR